MKPPVDSFPRSTVIIRWFLAAAEMGLATYFVTKLRQELGILFLTYGVLCVFVLLPAIRCVRCYYYGKRCNFGWGKWVSAVFPRAEDSPYASLYGFSILFWPLRIIPIALGLKDVAGIPMGGFRLDPHGLFLIYLLTILLHRRFYRARSCVRCHQRETCPVYDSRALLPNTERT